jgi:hypothetical protein
VRGLPFVAPVAIGTGAYLAAEGANDRSGITRESTRERQRKQQGKYNWWGKYDPPGGPSPTSPTSKVESSSAYHAESMQELIDRWTGKSPSPRALIPEKVEITGSGEVSGEVVVTHKFEAGDGLLKMIKDQNDIIAKISGRLNITGPGSVGKSSPDAMPTGTSYSYGVPFRKDL